MRQIKIKFNEPDQNGDIFTREDFDPNNLDKMVRTKFIHSYELNDKELIIVPRT